jgi:hypothetical protein
MEPEAGLPSFPFDPHQVLDEWSRFYDWAVLSRKRAEFVEAVSYFGQKFSSTFRAYRLAKRLQRRERLHAELLIAFDAMQAFYNSLATNDRIPLHLPRHDSHV